MGVPISIILATCLSFVGSFLTLCTYFLFKDTRNTSSTFALWYAFASIGYGALTFVAYIYEISEFCKIAATLETYFLLISVFTTVVVAYCMNNLFNTQIGIATNYSLQVENSYYFIAFVLPCFFAIIPWITTQYGKNSSDTFCWVETDNESEQKNAIGFMWEALSFFIPLILSLIYNAIIFVSIINTCRKWMVRILLLFCLGAHSNTIHTISFPVS